MARRAKRDRLVLGLLILIAGATLVGYLVERAPSKAVVADSAMVAKSPEPPVSPHDKPTPEPKILPETDTNPDLALGDTTKDRSFDRHFRAGAMLLAERRWDEARQMLELARNIRPHVPQVYVNLGFAYFELGKLDQAEAAFQRTIRLDPQQLNAYYGLAETLEAKGDLRGALGAMRTYVHLAGEDDPFVTRAKSATWEWQEKLKAAEGNQSPEAPATQAPVTDAPKAAD